MNIKLFEGEQLVNNYSSDAFLNEEEINQKYKSGEIRVVTEQGRYPLEEVARMFSNKEKYNDTMNYQRNYVWSTKMKSLLIESFIMNIPIPPIFLFEQEYSYYEILDGKQRISSIVDFYNDKYALEGLNVWGSLNGYTYSKLPKIIKEGLNRRYLSSVIMLKDSESDSFALSQLKKIIFERLNTGGCKLTSQEARNAIYAGPFNDCCVELAKSYEFIKAWYSPNIQPSFFSTLDVEKNLMNDSEIVLRFFAFRHLNQFEGNLNVFLDKYLDNANKFSDVLIKKMKSLFLDTIVFATELFDGYPFKERTVDGFFIKKKSDRFIYDPVMQVLSQYLDRKELLLNKRKLIQNQFTDIIRKNPDKAFNGKLQHKASIEKRIDIFENIIIKALDNEK